MHTLCFSVESACAFYSCKATLLVDGDGTSALWDCTGGTTPTPGTKKHGHGTMEHGENMGMEIIGKTSTNGNVHGDVQLPEYHEL